MKTNLTILGMVAVLLMGISTPAASKAQGVYAFAFAYQSGNRIHVNLLTRTDPAGYITSNTFEVPASHRLADAAASPDGRQIAFGFHVRDRASKTIVVLNRQTGVIHEMRPFMPWSEDTYETVERLAPYLWSPDSTWLAYIGYPEGEKGPMDIYLYYPADQRVINLTHGDQDYYRFAWSPDGRYLASLRGSMECNDAACNVALEIWDTVDVVRTTAIDLRSFLALAIPPRTAACYFDWSPDNTYLAFMMGCDGIGRFFFDMYVLNVPDRTIIQLTKFGEPAVLWNTQVQFGVGFASVWYDSRTLLIGSAARPIFPDPGADTIRISQTAAYTAPAWDETLLSPTVATEWALNPVSGQLAYRAGVWMESILFEDIFIQIATLAEKKLTPQAQSPVGCHLAWSPDGTILAYENYQFPGYTCLGLKGFTLVDGTSGKAVTIPAPTKWSSYPIGWILVEGK